MLSATNQYTVCSEKKNNNTNNTKITLWTFDLLQGKYMCYDCALTTGTAGQDEHRPSWTAVEICLKHNKFRETNKLYRWIFFF